MSSQPDTQLSWAATYLRSTELAHKLSPPPLPPRLGRLDTPLTYAKPGRPSELRVTWEKFKTPGREALRDPSRRAHLLHTFFHHELQAAELMCWAALKFSDAPDAFRSGLLSICLDEIRHMNLYATHIRSLGHEIGDFPVRDWFWSRAPAARTASEFCALMGLGFEAGNLDHCERFEHRFEAAGDLKAAALTRHVGEEEIAHVAFAAHWFASFEGELSFTSWMKQLPAPLSPMVMRGRPLNREARSKAGFSHDFLEELEAWKPSPDGG